MFRKLIGLLYDAIQDLKSSIKGIQVGKSADKIRNKVLNIKMIMREIQNHPDVTIGQKSALKKMSERIDSLSTNLGDLSRSEINPQGMVKSLFTRVSEIEKDFLVGFGDLIRELRQNVIPERDKQRSEKPPMDLDR